MSNFVRPRPSYLMGDPNHLVAALAVSRLEPMGSRPRRRHPSTRLPVASDPHA